MSYIDTYLPICEGFEGRIPWMYLDSLGNVTVGIGHLVCDSTAAIALPFEVEGVRASSGEVGSEFIRVRSLIKNCGPLVYKSDIVLPGAAIDGLVRTVVESCDNELRSRLKGYDELPDSWRMGLLDMAYNLGVAGLFSKFPHFILAVLAKNGEGAAAECNRPQLNGNRNTWTAKCFTEEV